MNKQEFIELFGNKAKQRYKETNILPSLIVAQACLESGYGTSLLSRKYNNFFGLNNYNDVVTSKYDKVALSVPQEYNGKIVYNVEYMCVFKSIDECLDCMYNWYLLRPKYKPLIGCKDYKECCKLVKELGYATDSKYSSKLITLIEEQNLTRFDEQPIEKIVYRVQVGSYSVVSNAIKKCEELKAKKYDTLIKKATVDNNPVYRVQVGAYHDKNNATNMLNKLKNDGYKSAFITTESGEDYIYQKGE